MPHYLPRKFVILFLLISAVASAQTPLVDRADYGGMCPDGPCGASIQILDDGSYLVNSAKIATLDKADVAVLKHSLETIDRSKLILGTGPCASAVDGADSNFRFYGQAGIVELNTCGQKLNFGIDPLLTYQKMREKYEMPWQQQEFAKLKHKADEENAKQLALRTQEDHEDERRALTKGIPTLSGIAPSVFVVSPRGTSFEPDEFRLVCEVNEILKGHVPAERRNPNGTITISFKRELADAVMRQFQRADWSRTHAIAFLKYEGKWISAGSQLGIVRMTDAVMKSARSAVLLGDITTKRSRQ